MQVYALARRISRDENQYFRIILERLLNLSPTFTRRPTVNRYSGILVAETIRQFFHEIIKRVPLFGEENKFFAILPVKHLGKVEGFKQSFKLFILAGAAQARGLLNEGSKFDNFLF